ncbi:MAG: amino acid permease [Actinobacteria bacterium]|uniref:Unannotated protein n=1 Tax=freshwater metagenome TaxID=449393 RepID=A0A6J6RWB9_9ZZZZ|nr:amino acid permease [Actinomycetota bacterium]
MTQVQDPPTAAPSPRADQSDRLGLPQSTALVMGSIIGVGIFSLPYAIASYGPISLAAMGIATVGAIALALMFSVMSRRLPADGGPYAYARAAFGIAARRARGWRWPALTGAPRRCDGSTAWDPLARGGPSLQPGGGATPGAGSSVRGRGDRCHRGRRSSRPVRRGR